MPLGVSGDCRDTEEGGALGSGQRRWRGKGVKGPQQEISEDLGSD